MKKRKLLLLSACLSVSCASQNAPQEIVSYLNGCSINKAFEQTKTISYSFTSNLYEEETKLGETSLSVYWDNSKSDDFYEYQKEEYTGSNISYDEEKNLYVTSKEIYSYLDQDDSLYHKVTYYKGYEKEETESEIKTIRYSDVKYQPSQFNSEKEVIFRSQSTSGISKGGVYYGDFFSNLLSYYPYMSIQDDLFVYTLSDYPYKNSDEEGIINEVARMNSLGLLVELTQTAKNTKTKKTSRLDVKVSYNINIERVNKPED